MQIQERIKPLYPVWKQSITALLVWREMYSVFDTQAKNWAVRLFFLFYFFFQIEL